MISGPGLADIFNDYFAVNPVKAMVVKSTYGPSPDHEFRSQVMASEIPASEDYPIGGVVAQNMRATWDAANDRLLVTCDEVNFGGVSTPDVGGVVFYVATGSSATERLLVADTFDPVAPDGGLRYSPPSTGLIVLTP